MFYLATQFARNKEICLEQILFYSFVAVNVSFSQQQKTNKWKKLIWSDLDYRKDVTVTMKLINYDLLLLDAIWLTTGVSRGL